MGHLLKREIKSPDALEIFSKCSSFSQLLCFIKQLAVSVENRSNFKVSNASKFVIAFGSFLKDSEIELERENYSSSSRYGNPIFRNWVRTLHSSSYLIINEFIEDKFDSEEINEYFVHSLGDTTRLDYGTCNELHFICFLFCLFKRNIVNESDFSGLILILFLNYWNFVKVIQKKFLLEPAGSLGAWGLDDYNFLPFLFGSSQLSSHDHLRPCSVRNPDVLKELSGSYLYVDAISNIIRAGIPLAERSPILNDITASKTWNKVYMGLLKMYEKNVLGKIQVMQHFLFCRIIAFDAPNLLESKCNAILDDHGDCCGNRLPSIFNSSSSKVGFISPID
jgi:serine/threonine-protein phosphatase 2A activator